MKGLVPATGALHETVLDQTYQLWGEGLSRAAYGQYNVAQLKTTWGAAHLRRVALVEGGAVLASAKRYDLTLRLDGRDVPALGIGAVFTPPERRGRGHAPALIREMMASAASDGAELAVLFSEIDPAYYERLGFVRVGLDTVAITVAGPGGAPAVLVRAGGDEDAPLLAEMHNARAAAFRWSLVHDADLVRFSIAKKRMFVGFGPPGGRAVEFFVAEEGHRACAYVVLQVNRTADGEARWSLEACGDRDPNGARVGAILQALVARDPAAPAPLIQAWWPRGFRPPQLEITPCPPAACTMMARWIDPSRPFEPLAPGDVCYWHGDAF